jgi:hypothetical protein
MQRNSFLVSDCILSIKSNISAAEDLPFGFLRHLFFEEVSLLFMDELLDSNPVFG